MPQAHTELPPIPPSHASRAMPRRKGAAGLANLAENAITGARFLYLAAQRGWRCGLHGPTARRLGRWAVVDTAGPGDGPEQGRGRAAGGAREDVQQMRSLPVEQILGGGVFSLLTTAQVQLRRRAAREPSDASAVALEHARPCLPGELTQQIDQVLGQLRLGQVSAEGRASQAAEPEDNDLDRAPAPPPGAPQSPAGPGPSRLWVPGR